VKPGWRTKKIGDVCQLMTGGTPSRANKEYFNGEIPWLVSGDIHRGEIFECDGRISDSGMKASNAKLLPINSVMIALNGQGKTRGTVALLRSPATCNQSLVSIYPKNPDELMPEFLYANLHGRYQEIRQMTGDSGNDRRGLNMILIRGIEIPIAPLPEQQRIVAILDEAFEGIATAKANAEKNLENARALFDSHLDSVLRQRGKGWVEKRLGDESLLEIVDGDRGLNYPNGSDFQEKGYCLFLNTKNVRPDGFQFESTMFITEEKDRLLRKGKLKRDDVVLTTRGTIGNVGIYSEDVPFDNIRINSGMLIFRPNKHALLPSFLFEILRSEIVKDQITRRTTGAAQPQLPIKTLVNFTIPVPTNLADQAALVKKLRAFEPETQRLVSIYDRKLVALDALKKSLLHSAFSGDLTSKKAAAGVEAAA